MKDLSAFENGNGEKRDNNMEETEQYSSQNIRKTKYKIEYMIEYIFSLRLHPTRKSVSNIGLDKHRQSPKCLIIGN